MLIKKLYLNVKLYLIHTHKKINTQEDDAHNVDAVIPMFNLIEYSASYSKTSGSLWQYYRDETV